MAENKDTLELLQQEVKNLENQIKEVTKSEESSFNFNLKDENHRGNKKHEEQIQPSSQDSKEESDKYSANYAYGFHNQSNEVGRLDISV